MKHKPRVKKHQIGRTKPNLRFKFLILAVAPFIAGGLLYLLLINLPDFSKKLIELTSSGSNNSVLDSVFSSIAIIISITFCFAVGLYLYVDYKMHSKPLKIEDPNALYTLNHHTRVVVLPLIRYKKKKISFVIFYPVLVILILGISVSASLSKVLAALPVVTTGVATNITHGTATLNGQSANTTANNITSRGFEYGLNTSYGSTLTQQVFSSSSYSTFGSLQNGNSASNGTVKVHGGFVYVGSRGKVEKFTTSGNFVSKIGGLGDTDGLFLDVSGIAFDSSDNIYVVDSGNSSSGSWRAVTKFDSNGNYLARWGTSGTGNGQFYYAKGIAVDSNNHVYVLDGEGNRVQKFDSNGNYISQWGSEGSGDGQFLGVFGIAIYGSTIYVADGGNNRIQIFDLSGNFISKWGSQGTGDGQFNFPSDVQVNGSTVYVTDGMNDRVQKFSIAGVFQGKWGTTGTNDGQLDKPLSIAIDASTDVYIVEMVNSRIQKFNTNGSYITKWGDSRYW